MSNDNFNNSNFNNSNFNNDPSNSAPSLSPSPQAPSGNIQPQATQNSQKAITDDHNQQAFLADNSSNNKLPSPDQVNHQGSVNQGNIDQGNINQESIDQGNLNNAALNTANLSGNQTAAQMTAQAAQKNGGRLELLEERPVISKERIDVGKVIVTKHTRTKTVNVPVELLEEYITVQTEFSNDEQQDLLTGNYDDKEVVRHVAPTLDNKAVVTVNGNQVEVGDSPVEIVISRQVATVTKDTYVVQEVSVSKTAHTHTDTVAVALQHEELDVSEEGFLSHPHN